MTLVLGLMRHGEAQLSSESGGDHDRPLSDVGLGQVERVAVQLDQYLRTFGLRDLMMLTSDARRTLQTAEKVCEFIPCGEPSHYPDLYNGGLTELRTIICAADCLAPVLLVVGHNPGVSHCVETLTNEPNYFETSQLALLRSASSSWKEAIYGDWSVDSVIRPG